MLSLSIPEKRSTTWGAETDPGAARAWLTALPLADSNEAGRELYQALYTLNRLDLDPTRRFELLELYTRPVTTVTAALQTHLSAASLPLSPKKRQVAEFVRQLLLEMANGYKCCLHDLENLRLSWGRKQLFAPAIHRALYYLGEVLARSYAAYLPPLPRTWADIHELFRYAESSARLHEPVLTVEGDLAGPASTVALQYVQVALLGAANPYQMPPGECQTVVRFVQKWGARTQIGKSLDIQPSSHFLLDLAADTPPQPFPRDIKLAPAPTLRVLNTLELARKIHGFITRLQKGEPVQELDLGVDCLDSACLDMLQRLMRAWGIIMRRQHARMKRHGYVHVCAGIPSMHFFINGQKPLPGLPRATDIAPTDAQALLTSLQAGDTETDEQYVALDEPGRGTAAPVAALAGLFHLDRWQVEDIGPKGLLLVHYGDVAAPVRVGDIVGIQRVNEQGHWSTGVVRWMKSPEPQVVQIGVELLAPRLQPVSLRAGASDPLNGHAEIPGFLLPAMGALHRPPTLVLPRGAYPSGADLMLSDGAGPQRRVRPLKLVERTHTFEQLVFADIGEVAA